MVNFSFKEIHRTENFIIETMIIPYSYISKELSNFGPVPPEIRIDFNSYNIKYFINYVKSKLIKKGFSKDIQINIDIANTELVLYTYENINTTQKINKKLLIKKVKKYKKKLLDLEKIKNLMNNIFDDILKIKPKHLQGKATFEKSCCNIYDVISIDTKYKQDLITTYKNKYNIIHIPKNDVNENVQASIIFVYMYIIDKIDGFIVSIKNAINMMENKPYTRPYINITNIPYINKEDEIFIHIIGNSLLDAIKINQDNEEVQCTKIKIYKLYKSKRWEWDIVFE